MGAVRVSSPGAKTGLTGLRNTEWVLCPDVRSLVVVSRGLQPARNIQDLQAAQAHRDRYHQASQQVGKPPVGLCPQ